MEIDRVIIFCCKRPASGQVFYITDTPIRTIRAKYSRYSYYYPIRTIRVKKREE